MLSIDFNNIPKTSSLFYDFLLNHKRLNDRFQTDDKLLLKEFFDEKARSCADRTLLINAINKSMLNFQPTDKQIDNIELLLHSNSVTVITGQQVGLFGGHIYSALKISSCLALANKLNKQNTNNPAIPVFWVEDNDHDAKESGEINFYTKSGELVKLSANIENNSQKSVSEYYYDCGINEIKNSILNNLQFSEFNQEVVELIEKSYYEGQKWTDAFINFHNELFGNEGILFVKASELRKTGVFGEFAKFNFQSHSNLKQLHNVLLNGKSNLNNLGYTDTAEPSIVNFFLHFGQERFAIHFDESQNQFKSNNQIFSIGDIHSIATSQPERYSPKVLLRPITQDKIFPNVATIVGPGEISYLSQNKEAYEYFNVTQPVLYSRLSATFLFGKHFEFANNYLKLNSELFNFLLDIEKIAIAEIGIDTEPHEFKEASDNIAISYRQLSELVAQEDKSLERTVESALHKTLELIKTIEKKYITARKQKNIEKIKKYTRHKNFIYPNNIMQERYFSCVELLNFYGKNKFSQILQSLADKYESKHIIHYEIL